MAYRPSRDELESFFECEAWKCYATRLQEMLDQTQAQYNRAPIEDHVKLVFCQAQLRMLEAVKRLPAQLIQEAKADD